MTPRAFACVVLVAALAACAAGDVDTAPDVGTSESASPSQGDSAASAGQSADGQPDDHLLTPDGWGPLRIGMTRAEIVAAAGEDAQPDAVGGPEPDRCDQFRPARAPAGLLVMVEDGVLTRVTLSRNTDIMTPEGIRIGDAGSAVLQAHGGNARVDLHKYQESPAKYITVWRGDAAAAERRGIRYEIGGDDHVAHIHAGGPSIEYVEGCL